MVSDVLAGARGEHLQECDLVGVGLVREVEAEVGNLREPDLPLARLHLRLNQWGFMNRLNSLFSSGI